MDVENPKAQTTLQRGLAAHESGELRIARACYLEILRDRPDDNEALQLLASVELHYGRLNNAERLLRRALAEQAEDSACWISLARVLERKGRLDEAVNAYARALALDPQAVQALHRRGLLLKRAGRLEKAQADLSSAVALKPESARLHNDLGAVLKQMGRHREAMASFEHAIGARPDYAYAHNNLGVGYLEEGRMQQASRCFESALEARPDMATAHDNLGMVHRETGDLESALRCHDAAVTVAPNFADAHAHRAAVLHDLGRQEAAEKSFRRALNIAPGHPGALAGIARILEGRGQFREGLELIEESARADDASPVLRIAAARLMRRVFRGTEALDLLAPLARQVENGLALPPHIQRELHFTLGHLHDQETQYIQAFEQFSTGNRLHATGFDPMRWSKHIDGVIRHFSRCALDTLPRSTEGEDLVFIVGMPRSGTTLVEQVLAAHPSAFCAPAGGAMGDLAHGLCKRLGTAAVFPECLSGLTAAAVREMMWEYRTALGPIPAGIARICDRDPLNFLQLGMIELLFPKARIVHCIRDPLDTALSCFFQDFADPALDFTTRLHHIVAYYSEYRRLMTHWKSVSRLSVFELRHEKLVLDQEGATRDLLEFVQLPWHSKCLRFHEVAAKPGSAVESTIRQPIYRRSIGRHLNYERFIQPFREALSH